MKGKTDTRSAIIEGAIRLLGRDGPEGFSAAALATEVGISKANVFHHFPHLHEIPLAAFDQLGAAMLATHPNNSPPLRRWLLSLGDRTLDITRNQRGFLNAYFVLFSRALFDRRINARLRQRAIPLLAAIAARMPPSLTRAEAQATARLVAMTLDGLALHVLALGEEGKARQAWRRFVDVILSREGDMKAPVRGAGIARRGPKA